MISFTVPGIPIAQPRVKATAIGGYVRVYTPKTADAYKASVALAFGQAYSGSPLTGPVAASIEFVMPRTKSMIWKTRPMPSAPHAKRPDIDNLAKAVMDALLGLAWNDDAQVYELTMRKFIASGDDQPRTLIRICYG